MYPDPDPAIFIIDFQDANKKRIFLENFFLHITFWSYIYIIFRDKKSNRRHITVEIKVFLTILLNDRSIQNRIRIQEAQKHVDPACTCQQVCALS